MAHDDAVVDIFTDGACSGNPGPGGWGVVLRSRGVERELSGAEPATTNNRRADGGDPGAQPATAGVRAALLDSTYLRDGITAWIERWKRNGWKTADRKPVKNVDLWQRLEAALAPHRVEWLWIKSHAGHPENERADALARQASKAARGD
jgi:ribonuclease HI